MLPGVSGLYNVHRYDSQRLDWLRRLDAELERLATEHLKAVATLRQ
jgi:hypothetical protein